MGGTDAFVQARIDLTAALRWASRLGFSEGVCNHFSLVAPGLEDRFLINPQGLHWSEITAADIVVVDGKGRVIEGRHTVEPTAFFIHARVHASKRAPACVLHTHMPYAPALTMLEGGRLDPASQNALRFYGKVAYDEEYNGLVLDNLEGDRIAAKLNGADVLFLANHGVIVCGDSVAPLPPFAPPPLHHPVRSPEGIAAAIAEAPRRPTGSSHSDAFCGNSRCRNSLNSGVPATSSRLRQYVRPRVP